MQCLKVTIFRAVDWRLETTLETNGGMLKSSRLTKRAVKYWFTFKDGTNVMMNGSKWTLLDYNLYTGDPGRLLVTPHSGLLYLFVRYE